MRDLESAFPNVSRETLDRLSIYSKLLSKWNPRINLVARSTLKDQIRRHFQDSAQVLALAPEFRSWVDLGSGGGFPGLVVAILAQEQEAPARFVLVESDTRKCAFLRTVSRETSVDVEIRAQRIEDGPPESFDIVSARALAPLPKLLSYASNYLGPDGTCLFLKGESYDTEVQDARKDWRFDLETVPSQSDPKSAVLKIRGAQQDDGRHR